MLKSVIMEDENKAIVDWSSFTVLIVEDDLANYKLLEGLLKKTKINILWAKSGLEAIKICDTCNDINLILMDVQLPEIDGFEASKIIKNKKPKLPVIIITASISNDQFIRPDYINYDGIISKPFNLNHLIDTIRNFLTS